MSRLRVQRKSWSLRPSLLVLWFWNMPSHERESCPSRCLFQSHCQSNGNSHQSLCIPSSIMFPFLSRSQSLFQSIISLISKSCQNVCLNFVLITIPFPFAQWRLWRWIWWWLRRRLWRALLERTWSEIFFWLTLSSPQSAKNQFTWILQKRTWQGWKNSFKNSHTQTFKSCWKDNPLPLITYLLKQETTERHPLCHQFHQTIRTKLANRSGLFFFSAVLRHELTHYCIWSTSGQWPDVPNLRDEIMTTTTSASVTKRERKLTLNSKSTTLSLLAKSSVDNLVWKRNTQITSQNYQKGNY